MSIPCKMRPAGLDSLPMGYTRLEFLESTGSQGINTGLLAKNITARIKHRPFASAGGHGRPAFFSERYEFVNGTGYYNNMYASVQTNQKGAGYLASIGYRNKRISAGFSDSPFGLLAEGEVNLKDLFVKCTVEGKGSKSAAIPSSFRDKDFGYLRLFIYNNEYIGYIYSFDANYDGTPAANYIPALDTTGRPCMFDLVSKQPFHNAGSGQFIAGLTMGQARNLASLPVPTTSNTLTISLPKEATLVLYNQDVNAAIAAAEAKGWGIDVQYRDKFDDESILNKYAECTTLAEMFDVNSNWKTDLTSEKEWIYPLTGLVSSGNGYQAYTNSFARSPMLSATLYCPNLTSFAYGCWSCNVKKVHFYAPRLVGGNGSFKWSKIEEITGDLSSLDDATYFINAAPIRSWTIPLPKLRKAFGFFQSCDKLDEIAVDFPSLSSADLFTAGCKLGKTSVLRICDSIPAYVSGSHPITLGVHVDHQSDAEVLTAIENAESKGWTVAVQWNGTPTAQTASTFGLRKPPVYAKLATSERPDGTVENFLDWGHYVTNWEENGYQEFASLEEAYEHFNLEMDTEEEHSN